MGAGRAPSRRRRDLRPPAAGGPVLVRHRRAARTGTGRDPLRRPGGRQPPRPPRHLAAAGRAPPARRRAAAGAAERGRARGGAAPARRCRHRAGAGGAVRAAPGERDIAAITYGANPQKKGLDRVLAAWHGARREGETLVVAGLAGSGAQRRPVRRHAAAHRVPRPAPARPRVRHRAAAGGLRHRPARGARRRLRARHDALTRPVRGAAARPRARSAARHHRSRGRDPRRARRPVRRLRRARRRAARAVAPGTVDRVVADELLPRLISSVT